MEQEKTTHSVSYVMQEYLEVVKLARSQNTALTYGKALKEFKKVLVKSRVDPETAPASILTEDMISKLAVHLKSFAPATEQLYIHAVARFYKYLTAERLLK